jgi:hypothetical protein
VKPADESFDLPRLVETDPGLAEELALLKTQLPDASELALLTSRLQLQGIDVATPPVAQTAPPSPWQKWLLGGGGAVAIGLGLWAVGPDEPAALTDRSAALSSALPAASSAATPASGAKISPGATRAETAPVQPGPVDGVAPLVAEAAAPSATAPPSDSPALAPPRTVSLPLSAPLREAEPGAASLAPTGGGRGGSVSSGARPPSSDAPTEIELLRDARLALKRSPATALELAERHTRSYPSGKLVQERELIAVSALIALGRRTAALGRAARFEQVFPQSPYRKQLAELLR